jgi:hypothetical protein
MFSMTAAWAQEPTAAIAGTVRDASDASVPGATVMVLDVETERARTAVTDHNGNYSVPAIPASRYELRVEKSGFKSFVRTGISLVAAQQAVVNVQLMVGDRQETVTITAEVPLIDNTTASTSGLVGEQQLKDLPLNGRSFDQLVTLNAGTANYTANYHSGTEGNAFSIAGHRPEENRFLINGIDYIGTDDSGQNILPSGASGLLLGTDAVREINVLYDTYGAQYGKRSGGQVIIVPQSGTNQMRGSMFEYLRNNALDARNFFDHSTEPPPLRRNQFGAALGGPIKKGRLFLFGNYEGFRQLQGLSTVSVVPDMSARQGLLPTGPGGAEESVAGLQPKILPFFAYWPEPNGPALGGGLAFNYSSPTQKIREDFGLTRFDYIPSNNDSVAATYTIDDGKNDTPQSDPIFVTSTFQRSQLLSLQETHTFSQNLLNIGTLGFSRSYAVSGTPTTIPIPPSLWLISGTGPGAISIGGGVVSTVAAAVTSPAGTRADSDVRNFLTGSDDVHFNRGIHLFSAGIWIQRVQQNLSGAHLALSGSVSYPSLTAFLQDRPTSFVATPNPTPLGYRTTEAAWYFEDDMRLSRTLSVRLGLRDEMTTGWSEVSDRAANYFFDSNGVILTDPHVGPSILARNNALALWQPRIGLAWDPAGTGKWSVKAGFGIYNDLQDNLGHRISANPPFNARLSIPNTPLLSIIPIPGGTQPSPSCNAQLQSANVPCSIFAPGGVDPEMHTPTVQTWNLTLEREITANLALRIDYRGSQAYHMPLAIDLNVAQPQICSLPEGCASGGVGTVLATVPQGTLYMPPGTRPNPFVAGTFSWLYQGTSSYHALDLSLVKRAARGLGFKVNYTFSKAIDLNSALTSSSGQNEPQSILDPYDLALSRGVSAFSLKHQFNASFTYALPFGRDRSQASNASGFLKALVGGWRWNGILTAQSGFPFTPQVGANVSGTGDTYNPDVPNWNPQFKGPVILGSPDRWYDPNAFARPSPGTFGDVSRGSLTGPSLFTLDTSLLKDFRLSEKRTLQFRAEAFNVLNRANFGVPSPVVFSGNNVAASAGVVTSTSTTSRQLQMALKLLF